MMSTSSPRSLLTSPIVPSSSQESGEQVADTLDHAFRIDLHMSGDRAPSRQRARALVDEELLRGKDRRRLRGVGRKAPRTVPVVGGLVLEASVEDERGDVLHLVRIEPRAVASAPVDDHARAPREILALHRGIADGALSIDDLPLPEGPALSMHHAGRRRPLLAPPLPNTVDEAVHDVPGSPETDAHRAFVHPEPTESSRA